ncbi:MAG: histidine triad nucleotide-binding protein [Legionella sp. 40-6]|nr:histidine triad nucleotide-binding protein [Legionella sp.]OJY01985.1 MAG: histidine triad nucleotide-binding protein [Legionella sp. 40-6]
MECLFCNIANGSLSVNKVFEDDELVAFHDIRPQAPTHLLIIPKRHIATVNHAVEADQLVLGKMILQAQKLAALEGFSEDGYRLVFNVNPNGGQTVYHIHLHLLGGRQMTWPPG